ncbi:hypothetical protein LEMLEM_LOCUS25397, partial [Lemmus lemmus]
ATCVVSSLLCAVVLVFSASTAIKEQGPCQATPRPGRGRKARRELGGQAAGRDGLPREDTCHGVEIEARRTGAQRGKADRAVLENVLPRKYILRRIMKKRPFFLFGLGNPRCQR